MKITICGSMTFAKQMLGIKKKLEAMGHTILIPCDTDEHISKPDLIDNLEEDFKHCLENDVLKDGFSKVEESDAILILNYPKNDVEGYVGTSTLMELGLAYYLGKKIYLLNGIPESSKVRWAHEVRVMQPIIINGDLTKIE